MKYAICSLDVGSTSKRFYADAVDHDRTDHTFFISMKGTYCARMSMDYINYAKHLLPEFVRYIKTTFVSHTNRKSTHSGEFKRHIKYLYSASYFPCFFLSVRL